MNESVLILTQSDINQLIITQIVSGVAGILLGCIIIIAYFKLTDW